MPELPEVETVRADLEQSLVGCEIASVKVLGASSLVGLTARQLSTKLKSRRFVRATRRAKWLLLELDDDSTLAVHLRMTGQLIHVVGHQAVAGASALQTSKRGLIFETGADDETTVRPQSLPHRHTRLIFTMTDGSVLYFNDQRRFGTVEWLTPQTLAPKLLRYGLEPLTDNWQEPEFIRCFKGRRTSVKALLLNQTVIAGLGNIYVDESCFHAGVRPRRRAAGVTRASRKALFESITRVIEAAVASRGTTFSDYRDGSGARGGYGEGLMVYGRGGEPCRVCEAPIQKVTHGGRGTHYCPECQQ